MNGMVAEALPGANLSCFCRSSIAGRDRMMTSAVSPAILRGTDFAGPLSSRLGVSVKL
jgi:hypothetical protein